MAEWLPASVVDRLLAALVWVSGLLIAVGQVSAQAFQGQGWAALYKLLLPLFPAYVIGF